MRVRVSLLPPMAKTTKQGSHKPYGPKMANPRFTLSKEKRSCGPLGYKLKKEAGTAPKKVYKQIAIRRKKRLQWTREDVLQYFELE